MNESLPSEPGSELRLGTEEEKKQREDNNNRRDEQKNMLIMNTALHCTPPHATMDGTVVAVTLPFTAWPSSKKTVLCSNYSS